MPLPFAYRHADREWRAFLDDVKEQMSLESDNMAYTAVEGVLRAFRARLTLDQIFSFAEILPVVLRAILLQGLRADHIPVPMASRATLLAEVKDHRPHHNLTPDNAIEATAYALRRTVNARDFAQATAGLSPDLIAFWDVPGVPERDLERQMI